MGTSTVIGERKTGLRRRLIAARRALTPAERRHRSQRIQERCRRLGPFRDADVISSFIGYGEEVETAEFLRALLDSGRRLAVPTQRAPGGEPSFSEIRSWGELHPNSLGILEPDEGSTRPLGVSSIPFFLIPGIAFDPAGRRLGYGMGFYDRALRGHAPEALLVGLCFDFQIAEEVPVADHDLPVDLIISDNRIIAASPKVKHTEEVF